MRYYSISRPVAPGTYPARAEVREIKNFDERTYCEEIGRTAWGYLDMVGSLLDSEAEAFELVKAGEREWWPVMVASKKRGGGLKAAVMNDAVRATQRPQDERFETRVREFKRRYFSSLTEAERVAEIINTIEVTTERTRSSATQGECRVYINGEYILNYADKIVLIPKDGTAEDYYGANIGGWASSSPDSGFTLGLIWPNLDCVYHYSDVVCEKLGITQNEWIEREAQA